MLSSVPWRVKHHELAGPRTSLLADPLRSCAVALLPSHAPSSGRRISHDCSHSLVLPASTEPPGSGCAL